MRDDDPEPVAAAGGNLLREIMSGGIIGGALLLVLVGSLLVAVITIVRSARAGDGHFSRSIIIQVLLGFFAMGLGVLGCALGMREAFRAVAMNGATADPSVLAQGYSSALVTAILGALILCGNLLVAILGTIIGRMATSKGARQGE